MYRIKSLKWIKSYANRLVCRCVFGDMEIMENSMGCFCLSYPNGFDAYKTAREAKRIAERWYRRHLTKALTKVKASKVTGNGE